MPINGATGSGYTLNPTSVATDNGAQFSVVVSNTAGAVTSTAATLTVDVPSEPPSILVHPADLTVVEPNEASFSVEAAGTVPLSYQWRRDGTPINGATGSSYTLSPTARATDQGAQFSVVVSNAVGTATSLVATLMVTPQPPNILIQPANLNVVEPEAAEFSVEAVGMVPLSYQWWRDGTPINGATGSSYTLRPTAQAIDHGAQFRVVVSDGLRKREAAG